VLDEILADEFVHLSPEGMILKKEQIDFVPAQPFRPFRVHKIESSMRELWKCRGAH
jgi:hypothetical protein